MTTKRLLLASLLGLIVLVLAWILVPSRITSRPRESEATFPRGTGSAPRETMAVGEPHPEASHAPDRSGAGCSLCGRVTLDDQVLPAAAVTLRREQDFDVVETLAASSDPAGRFCFQGLTPGFFRVSAWRDGSVPAGAKTFECVGEETADIVLALRTGDVTIRGRVEGSDGNPVAGAAVVVYQDRRGTIFAGSAVVPLDREGRFGIRLLANAEYRVDATAPGYKFAGTSVKPAPGTTEEVVLVLKREAFVHGIVTASGTPIAGARVTALGLAAAPALPTTSAADGRFSLPAPLDKRFAIAAVSGTRFGSAQVEALPEDAVPRDVVVELTEGRSVRGIVRLADGTPQPLAEVFFRHRRLGLHGRAQCGLDGRFVIEGLPRTEGVELWAGGGYHPRRSEPGEADIELELRPGRHALDGKGP